MRQPFPDGATWVRTEPIAFSFDWRPETHAHDWHQLTFALDGHVEVDLPSSRALVPPASAIVVPAGLPHRESLWAPVTVRTLYVAPGAIPRDGGRARTVSISPLLRALILRACDRGALDRRRPQDVPVIDLLLQELADAPDVSFELPTPSDPRARRVAEALRGDPGNRAPAAALARGAGASRRTLERLFRAETGLGLAGWRRRLRILHARRLLDRGHSVSEVADAVGYATPSAFTAAFRRELGSPPRSFRPGGPGRAQ